MVTDWGWSRVVLRTSWARSVAMTAPHLVILAIPLLGPHRPGAGGLNVPFFGLLYLSLAVFTVGMTRRNSVTLDPGTLVIKAGYRTRRIAAADIRAVTVERVLGSRYVTVWTRDGQSRRLGPPGRTDGLVRETFDRDWHRVGDWWLANGGELNQEQPWSPPTLAAGAWLPNGFDWQPRT